MIDKESPSWVLGFAATVALACSLLVTTTVQWLRPIQAAYASIQYNRVILEAAGLAEPGAEVSDAEAVRLFLDLDVYVVDFHTGSPTSDVDPLTYDYRPAAELDDPPRYMPVYVLEQDGAITRVVFPIYGEGMWDTIHGTVTVGPDLRTIERAYFHQHGETPGIGDVVQDLEWLDKWRGVHLYDDDGNVCFDVLRRRQPRTPCTVDLVTGATVTVEAVEVIVREWFGPDRYGSFIRSLTPGEAR